MKKINLFIIGILIIFPYFSFAQCKEFTETEAVPLLDDYILSGRYSSIKLGEGEQILIFKTLNKGISYRFIVCGADELPDNIEYEILDWDDNQIYDNKTDSYAKVWDYKSASTQRIKIIIKVPDEGGDVSEKACVTLVTGIKNLEGGGY